MCQLVLYLRWWYHCACASGGQVFVGWHWACIAHLTPLTPRSTPKLPPMHLSHSGKIMKVSSYICVSVFGGVVSNSGNGITIVCLLLELDISPSSLCLYLFPLTLYVHGAPVAKLQNVWKLWNKMKLIQYTQPFCRQKNAEVVWILFTGWEMQQ